MVYIIFVKDPARAVADLATYWNRPIVNWTPHPIVLTDKSTYNTLLGSFGDIYMYAGKTFVVIR